MESCRNQVYVFEGKIKKTIIVRILIIGCGNIGALYDFENESILTHAKAFYYKKNTDLFFYDIDLELAKRISEKYAASYLPNLEEVNFIDFDCICICTPTGTHFQLLKRALKSNTRLVICEKPVSNSEIELLELKELYQKTKSKVIVNYIRRFQPSFSWLKKFIEELLIQEKLTNLSIRYQRGFINNCTHAFDLIAYLTSTPLELTGLQKQNLVFDHFEMDPTLSLIANWDGVNVSVLGLSNVLFSHFEIDLYFKTCKIAIKQSGDQIDIFQTEVKGRILNPLTFSEPLSKKNCLNNYMLPVIDHAVNMLEDESINDNFLESVNLNLSMLKYLN